VAPIGDATQETDKRAAAKPRGFQKIGHPYSTDPGQNGRRRSYAVKPRDRAEAAPADGNDQQRSDTMKFNVWLDTFLSEKGIDGEQVLTVEGPSGENYIPVACLVEMMKQAPRNEQEGIKAMVVKIDFLNGDVLKYFKHLAQAVAI